MRISFSGRQINEDIAASFRRYRQIDVNIRISFPGRQIDENIATNFSGIDK